MADLEDEMQDWEARLADLVETTRAKAANSINACCFSVVFGLLVLGPGRSV